MSIIIVSLSPDARNVRSHFIIIKAMYFRWIAAPSVRIIDGMGETLVDKYYEADSTIELLCVVRHIAMQMQYSVVQWLHGNRTLNYDTTRGGIR